MSRKRRREYSSNQVTRTLVKGVLRMPDESGKMVVVSADPYLNPEMAKVMAGGKPYEFGYTTIRYVMHLDDFLSHAQQETDLVTCQLMPTWEECPRK